MRSKSIIRKLVPAESLVVIAGGAASGKTTFARALADNTDPLPLVIDPFYRLCAYEPGEDIAIRFLLKLAEMRREFGFAVIVTAPLQKTRAQLQPTIGNIYGSVVLLHQADIVLSLDRPHDGGPTRVSVWKDRTGELPSAIEWTPEAAVSG